MIDKIIKLFPLLLLTILCWLIGFYKFDKLPPDSYHLGAQTDRASIVFNYWQNNTTFLYPKIMENRNNDGIVGCEFPGLYFAIAQLFKITGFRYDYYRLIVFLFYLIGIWSAFQIANFYVKQSSAFIITVIWACSPILCFYALNFLPDVPAMGLSMLGWRMVLKQRKQKTKLILGFFIFACAALLKVSYATHLAVAFSIYVIENRKIQWQVAIAGIICIGAVAAWYEWARLLNETFRNEHFLLKPNPAINFPDFIALIGDNWKNWQSEFYSTSAFLIIIFGVFTLFVNKIEQKLLRIIALRLWILSIIFYLLFQTQFKYHDYYLIAFYPLSFFLLLIAFIKLKSYFVRVWVLKIIFLIVAYNHFFYAKRQLNERHKTDSYYYQPPMPKIINQYIGIDAFLDKHIDKKTSILTAFDDTPNATLFFARRKGARIALDFNDDVLKEVVGNRKSAFVISNNDSLFKARMLEIDAPTLILIDSFRDIHLLKFETKKK